MQNDKSLDTPKKSVSRKEFGETGTQIFNGIITNEEYNRDLTGQSAYKIFDQMRRSDATIRSALQAIKQPIINAMWSMQPALAGDEQEEYRARFIEDQIINHLEWKQKLVEVLTFCDFGFSSFELVYAPTEFEKQFRIGLSKLAFRKQRSILAWEMADGKPGVQQQTVMAATANIPADRMVVFTHEREGDNYQGMSILRFCYKSWYMKDALEKVNAIALEKMGVGVPVIEHPADASETDKENARNTVRNMRANEASYIEKPTGWVIEMLDMKGNTTKEIIPSIEYHDHQILKSILAQFLDLGGASSSGSHALSKDQTTMFHKSLEATASNITATMQKQLVERLCDANFSEFPNGYPRLTFSKISDEDVTILADALQKLTSAGVVKPDAELEGYVRKVMKLPEAMEDTTEDNEDSALDNKEDIDEESKKKVQDKSTKASVLAQAKTYRKQLIDLLNEA